MTDMNNLTMNKLLLLFHHREIDIRWKAAVSISRYGARAVEPLLKQIYDDDQNVRILSIWALGRIGDERAISPITRSLREDNDLIRMASEGALSRLNRV
jgi:HEAT repeat protein